MSDLTTQPMRELAITNTNSEGGYDVHQMKMAVQRAVKGVQFIYYMRIIVSSLKLVNPTNY